MQTGICQHCHLPKHHSANSVHYFCLDGTLLRSNVLDLLIIMHATCTLEVKSKPCRLVQELVDCAGGAAVKGPAGLALSLGALEPALHRVTSIRPIQTTKVKAAELAALAGLMTTTDLDADRLSLQGERPACAHNLEAVILGRQIVRPVPSAVL